MLLVEKIGLSKLYLFEIFCHTSEKGLDVLFKELVGNNSFDRYSFLFPWHHVLFAIIAVFSNVQLFYERSFYLSYFKRKYKLKYGVCLSKP